MLIYNVNVRSMCKKDHKNGYIRIMEGKIVTVGDMEELNEIPMLSDIDAEGMTAYPGFIDCHTHLGVWENGLGFEGDDGNEETDPCTPHLRAIDMVNPGDFCFEEALKAGVTTVGVGMGSANPIGGSTLAMKTGGSRRIDNRIVKNPVGIKFALGENPKSVYNDKDETPITRMATAAIIREALHKARRYREDLMRAKKTAGKADEIDPPEYDIKCEALIPLLDRRIKAHFHCHRADDIFTAIRIAKEFDLDAVLIHATEGGMVAEDLKNEEYPCVVGPIVCDRGKPELVNLTISNGATLCEAGLKTAICTDHPELPVQYLPLSAGLAIRGGMSEEEALAAITTVPAEILGISDRVGTIEVGKDADIVLFSGKFYDVLETPKAVILNGKVV